MSEKRVLKIATPRLTLVAATPELTWADLDDRTAFEEMLGAAVSLEWPPSIFEDKDRIYFAKRLENNPESVGWWHWYFILGENSPRLIGNGGFGGFPDDEGSVMVGYSLLPQFYRRGYASEAVAALIDWAFADVRVRRIVADVFPDLAPSIGLLRKCGFVQNGGGDEAGTIRFERRRAG